MLFFILRLDYVISDSVNVIFYRGLFRCTLHFLFFTFIRKVFELLSKNNWGASRQIRNWGGGGVGASRALTGERFVKVTGAC